MIGYFFLFSLTGLILFYLQNLLLFPQVHLSLLELLVFYAGLRPSLPLAFALALGLGALQDSYAATPFGLHLVASLALVAAARFSRRRFLPHRVMSQLLASLGALAFQEGVLRFILVLTGARNIFLGNLAGQRLWQILGTAALAPLMFALFEQLEKFLGRHGWRTMSA